MRWLVLGNGAVHVLGELLGATPFYYLEVGYTSLCCGQIHSQPQFMVGCGLNGTVLLSGFFPKLLKGGGGIHRQPNTLGWGTMCVHRYFAVRTTVRVHQVHPGKNQVREAHDTKRVTTQVRQGSEKYDTNTPIAKLK